MMRIFPIILVGCLAPACLIFQPLDDVQSDLQSAAGSGGSKPNNRTTGGQCGLSFTDECLDRCVNGTCCQQVSDCMNNAACKASYECAMNCEQSDDACYKRCFSEHSAGFSLLSTMLSCVSDSCSCSDEPASGNEHVGGSGGTANSPSSCGSVVKPDAARVRACLLDIACDPFVPTSTLSECVTFGSMLHCNAAARSCADVNACEGTKIEEPSKCAATDTGWKCAGDVAIRCGTKTPYSIDCTRNGAICDPAGPDDWPCRVSTPTTCDDSPDAMKCAGDTWYRCIGGKPRGLRCDQWGQVCVESEPGKAACASAISCDDSNSSSCRANSIEYCSARGRLGVFDCTPAGSSCDSAGYCLAPGCTTKDADDCQESCVSGTQLQICVGGAPYTVDCTSYGFSKCLQLEHPTTKKQYVTCR